MSEQASPSKWSAASAVAAAMLVAGMTTMGIAPPDVEPIEPIPHVEGLDVRKVRLGERLFNDPRLSRDGTIACVSCHQPALGGADGLAIATGADGRPLDFNSPTVFNAALSFRLNWRGNFRTLEEQNEAVLLDPRLMNMTWDRILDIFGNAPEYRREFESLYGTAPQRAHVLDALAVYQRSLITPDAPFDRFLRGERDAITPEQQRGYELFKSYGCVACHQGVNVGGNLFQKFGVFEDPSSRRDDTEADLGRLTITGREEDRHVFRVPSLRNVALTAPYFHDGRAATLEKAIDVMARRQLGRTLDRQDIAQIKLFLEALTGTYRGRSLASGADPP